MKKEIDRTTDKIALLLTVYTVGLLMGGLLYLLKALKRIRISHWERFPRKQSNLIVVSNHPSLVEPILLPVLFFREYIFHPFKFSPWSTPDRTNYYDKWYWFWLRPRAVPIDRDNQRKGLKALLLIKKILTLGGTVILFPEGGRTFRGENFFFSKRNKKIRTLKEGIGWLISRTDALILPVWVDGAEQVLPNLPDKLYHTFPRFWKGLTIKIGKPLRFERPVSREEVTQKLVTILLKLADEPCAF